MSFQDISLSRLSIQYLIGEELLCLLLAATLLPLPYFILDRFSILWWSVLGGCAAVYLFFAALYFPIRYFRTGYYVSQELVFYQTGFFFLKTSLLARKRVIFTATLKSPVTPLLGFCSLVLQAPGAKIKIPGLPEQKARLLLKKFTPVAE